MLRTPLGSTLRRPARLGALLAALVLLPGCGALFRRSPPPQLGFQRLLYETARVLDVEDPDPAYYRERARLEVMGRELDAVLVALITDPAADDNVRVNAMALLADRRGFNTTGVLRRVLVSSSNDALRAAAAAGLQRFAADSPQVREALRAALGDPARGVRLAALQAMDVEDAPLVRALAAREDDPQVRVVARQLVVIFEGRGAPLPVDPRGDLRSTGDDTVPRIVFHPVSRDVLGGVDVGALWVELPGGRGLVPLAQQVEVVRGAVPAFLDPQRRAVVYEADRRVQVRDLVSGRTHSFGAGIAPRPVPFTDRFVFLREVPGSRRKAGTVTEVDYTVLRGSFAGGAPERMGTLHATIRPERFHGASPVRVMVVGEVPDGFVLRAPDVAPFVLPGPYENAPQRP